MPEYRYEALDANGQFVQGNLDAESVAEAVRLLEPQGLRLQSIAAVPGISSTVFAAPLKVDSSWSGPAPSTLQSLLDKVMQQRDSLVPALQALASELPFGRTKREAEQLGRALSEARDGADLGRNKLVIRWLPMLVSESDGANGSRRLAEVMSQTTRELQNRNEHWRLMAYPIVVLITALMVLGLLCLLVVPIFEKMFVEFGIRLPAPTQMVLAFTRLFQHGPVETLLLIIVAAGTLYGFLRLWTHYSLTTRLFGPVIAGNSAAVSAMSTLTGQLAELLQVGVPLPDALWIAGQGCEHHYYRSAAEQLAREVQFESLPLQASRAVKRFPANVIHALSIRDGQPSIPLLRELSEIYSRRAQGRGDWTTGLFAQIAIVLIGFVVGFVVIALFMPLVTLITGLS
jgi:type II secretory pathway component PulF